MPFQPSKIAESDRAQWHLAVFALALFGLFIGYFMWQSRVHTLERERSRLLMQIRAIDANLTQQLAAVHASMFATQVTAPVAKANLAANQRASQTLGVLTNAMPAVRTMQVLDPAGTVVSSSRAETLGFDASERAYFRTVKADPRSDTLYVSAPFTTTMNVYALNLARAWTNAEHGLLGVTTATLDPVYFKVLLRSVLYTDDMRATLVHGDGLAFLTEPGDPVIVGADLGRPGTLFSRHLASGQQESFFMDFVALTGDQRMLWYRSFRPQSLTMDRPLMLAVSRDMRAVLAPWRQLLAVVMGAYAMLALLVLGGVRYVGRKQKALSALQQAHHQHARTQAERHELALAGGNLGWYDLDVAAGTRTTNARAREIVGDQPGDPADNLAAWAERVHPEDRAHARLVATSTREKQSDAMTLEYRVRHRAGHWVWLHSRGMVTQRAADGKAQRFVGTYMDITDRVLAEQALRDERTRLGNIITGTNAGTWEHNLATGETRVNPKYEHMLGYATGELPKGIPQRFGDLVHPEDQQRALQAWKAHLSGATDTYEVEFRVKHKAGHWLWVLSNGKVWSRDADGKGLNISGINLDVSETKAAQAALKALNAGLESRVTQRTAELEATLQQLRDSQANLASSEARATLSTLIASISHELANPLGNCVIASGTLRDVNRDFQRQLSGGALKRSDMTQFAAAVEQGTDIIAGNLQRASGLLNNFRQVAADQASEQRRAFDLAQVVQETMQSIGPSLKRHPHRVVLDIPEHIAMDSLPGPLGQVIINLVNNAFLHAFEGQANGQVSISAQAQGGQVTLTVRDNGVGIPPQHLDRIFDPFFSTKIGKGGTGLGMAIVKNLVGKSLGGSVTVHSTVGEGTAFVILLPRVLPAG